MRNLLGLAAILLFFAACNTSDKKLPIYGERDAVVKSVDGKDITDTLYHTIPAFNFIDQYGDSVSNKTLEGKIYVADFFFTSCPSICPIMHRNMLNVYAAFKNVNDFNIISYSIDPKRDSIAVLKDYANKLGITDKKWLLLQGKKEDTYKLSESYLVKKPEEDAKEQFIHDGYFILVDKQKRIRGSYDGTDIKQVEQLIADIKTLQTEPEQTTAK